MGIFKMYRWLNPSVLSGIDSTIRSEVLPYVKQVQSLPFDIQNDANTAAIQESIGSFVANLKNGWCQHNETAVEIDAFLASFYKGDITLDDIEGLRIARRLLIDAFRVERKKRVYSAGVKVAIEHHLPRLVDRFRLSKEDVNILLSTWRVNFWTYRYGEHCLYRLRQIEGNSQAKTLRRNITNVFHAGEDVLFRSRVHKICGDVSKNKTTLRKEVANYIKYIRHTQEMEIHGGYLVLGRADLKSVQELIQYDNRDEYIFGYNLYGVPDLFLRKEITQFLFKRGYLPILPSVLQYTEREILSGLQRVEEDKHKHENKK